MHMTLLTPSKGFFLFQSLLISKALESDDIKIGKAFC